MPSNHLILCHPLLLLPSIFPSIRVFSKVSALHMRWPNYWNFNVSPFNEYSELISASCKEPTCQCRRCKRHESDPWVGKIPWRRVRNPLWYSSLGNPMDRGVWWATVHRATKSWTWLSDLAQGGQRQSQVRSPAAGLTWPHSNYCHRIHPRWIGRRSAGILVQEYFYTSCIYRKKPGPA